MMIEVAEAPRVEQPYVYDLSKKILRYILDPAHVPRQRLRHTLYLLTPTAISAPVHVMYTLNFQVSATAPGSVLL